MDVASFRKRRAEIEQQLASPGSHNLAQLGKELSRLNGILALADEVEKLEATCKDLESAIASGDADLIGMAKEEFPQVQEQLAAKRLALEDAIIPEDPDDSRDAIVEIRAGTGGDEAALFAQDLFRMYSRYAERHGWSPSLLSSSRSDLGGVKEVVFRVAGDHAFGLLKHEAGVHRVQRVPETEKAGRVHTSTATVAVLPKLDPIDLVIDPKELRIDTSTSQGAGGQSVNTTYSAIRIVHLPTGLIVTCQDERSQLQNRERAMEIMRARLWAIQEEERRSKEEGARRSQIGAAKRSEKIRTYNFPQDRVTDHRVNMSLHNLPQVLDGKLDDLLDALRKAERAEAAHAAQ